MDLRRLRNDLLALVVMGGTVYLGLCLASYDPADAPSTLVFPVRDSIRNIGGPAGARIASALITTFGAGAFLVPIVLAVWDLRLFSRTELTKPAFRLFGAALVLTAVVVGLHLAPPVYAAAPPVGNGGYVGAWGAILLQKHFEPAGVMAILGSALLAGLLLADEVRLLRTLLRLVFLPLTIWDRIAFRRSVKEVAADDVAATPPTITAPPATVPVKTAVVPKPAKIARPVEIPRHDGVATIPVHQPAPVVSAPIEVVPVNPPLATRPKLSLVTDDDEPVSVLLPTTALLDEAEEFPYEILAKKAQLSATTLEKAFKQFGLNIRVVAIDTGPVITQFELELEAGLRLSKVTALADDLAIALRVPSVRVVAPIPGKNTVGVEVPNDVRVMVRLKELLESCRADFADKRIPLFLGKDVSGKPMVVDLSKMPHLLIAGRTGTGKSVCLNTLILSMLMSRSPEQVKMLMIDPKMVELSPYMRIPHLMHPVITDMKKAEAVLGWAVDKMEERYDLLARCGVRHLDSYNKLGKTKVLERLGIDADSDEADLVPDTMPYIVIVADEMADMMMTSGKDVEGYIIRLAQKSRAVGIHLVLATQKPTVDVITGLIKSNLPARIAFQVSSRVDSRVVLDEQGADKLLGSGDMLYLPPGTSDLIRGQGTFVSDEEVMRVIDFFSDQEPQYSQEIVQVTSAAKSGSKPSGSEARERDDLYEQAVEVVIREGRGSVSLLQRALGVGYGRGARMIDWMAEDGIVGSYNGSQAREVIMTLDQWEDTRAAV
ncbi:MAG: DNA translocase FtsK 4TM domain-containing protein [Planctomycetaceae bacterium]|nr:DNA translocase FtsK 4TM domain-containing protein [Planctomycetaceae bacterium]